MLGLRPTWPNGPVCPHCGGVERISKMHGKITRIGSLQVLRVPQAVHREGRHRLRGQPRSAAHVAAGLAPADVSKKGIQRNQLHRTLRCRLKTAWFMSHRIREAMRAGCLPADGRRGRRRSSKPTRPSSAARRASPSGAARPQARRAVAGRARRQGPQLPCRERARPTPRAHREREHRQRGPRHDRRSGDLLQRAGRLRRPRAVNHSADEYVSRRCDVHTNTVEGYFSIFKRGMKGVYQHCGEKHLAPLLARVRFPLQQPRRAWRRR